MPIVNMNKKRKFVADGVFYAELNEFLTRQLSEDGYSGLEIRVTPVRTEVIIRATRTQGVLGERGRRIKELTALVQKRFGFAENSIELFVERVENRGLCAIAQCESLRFKLLNGVAVRKAANSLIRFIMESGAKGVEVMVSGKVRGQRAKGMKFVEGFLVHSGNPIREYLDTATRHVLLRQGVLGVKVKIMLPHDPTGMTGPKKPLPDTVTIIEPKAEESRIVVPIESKVHTAKAQPQAPYPSQGGHGMAPLDDGMHRMNIHDSHQMAHY